jgi:hypothetical protein
LRSRFECFVELWEYSDMYARCGSVEAVNVWCVICMRWSRWDKFWETRWGSARVQFKLKISASLFH